MPAGPPPVPVYLPLPAASMTGTCCGGSQSSFDECVRYCLQCPAGHCIVPGALRLRTLHIDEGAAASRLCICLPAYGIYQLSVLRRVRAHFQRVSDRVNRVHLTQGELVPGRFQAGRGVVHDQLA